MSQQPLRPVRVGLLGIGTVGGGTFNVLKRNQEEIRRRAGRGIEIAMVADLNTERAREVVGDQVQIVADARQVIANPDIDVVVELIGGYGIAKALVLEAIAAGKHVVTANKALLAVHGTEIFAAARAKGVRPLRLLLKYPVRMALNPLISTLGWILPAVVSGEIIVSVVMSLPTTGPLLLRALCMGDVPFLEMAMAQLGQVPVSNARLLIHDAGRLGLKSLFDRTGLPPKLYPALRIALDVANETEFDGLDHDLERHRRRMLERILTQFEELASDDVDYLLTKLSDLRVAAA